MTKLYMIIMIPILIGVGGSFLLSGIGIWYKTKCPKKAFGWCEYEINCPPFFCPGGQYLICRKCGNTHACSHKDED